jgi:hypothetical protein
MCALTMSWQVIDCLALVHCCPLYTACGCSIGHVAGMLNLALRSALYADHQLENNRSLGDAVDASLVTVRLVPAWQP